jgi:hypothetical protein
VFLNPAEMPLMVSWMPRKTYNSMIDAGGDEMGAAPLAKSVRKRSKAHLAFVASHRCVICKASPCDAHH